MRYAARVNLRHDRVLLASPIRRVDGVIYEGVAARIHTAADPLRYGKRTEQRDRSELRRIVRDAPGTRIIVLHPDPNKRGPDGQPLGGRVSDEPVVGTILSARLDGDFAVVRFEVTDPRGIAAIEREGWRELSLGYGARLDALGFQRGTNIDHMAIVPTARCGDACTIRTDCSGTQSACPCQAGGGMQKPLLQDNTMKTKPTDQVTHADALRSLESQRSEAEQRATAAEATAAAEKLRADTADGKIIELEAQISELNVKIAAGATAAESDAIMSEKQRADAAEAQVAQFDAKFEARVNERVELVRRAEVIMGGEFRTDGLSDREIMASVVKRLDSGADVSNAVADGVIRGRFLAAADRHASSARALARVAEVTANTTRVDAAAEARKERRQAWRKPLPNAQVKR